MNLKFISIIPARGGSKGIPRKNIKLLNNKPLIAYSIEQSLKAKLIDETYVSTEDEEIASIAKEYGARVIERPPEYATDTATTDSVLLHSAKFLNNNFDYIVLLPATSPIRFSSQIDDAINLIIKKGGDSLLSVYQNDTFLWDKNGKSINYNFKKRPRRQDKEWEYVETGFICITKKETLLKEKNRLGGKILFFDMPKWMSFEIDEPFDFELIEWIIKTKFERCNQSKNNC